MGWLSAVPALGEDQRRFETREESPEDAVYESFEIFTQVFKLVKDSYVEPVNTDILSEGAVKGMLLKADKYGIYFGPNEMIDVEWSRTGSGSGIIVGIRKGTDPTVIDVMENSPAAEHEIRPGDIIWSINDTFTGYMTIKEIHEAANPPEGQGVQLRFWRGTAPEPETEIEEPGEEVIERIAEEGKRIDLDIVSKKLDIPPVFQPVLLQENIAYIKIPSVINERVIDKILQTLSAGEFISTRGWIIDLRNNCCGFERDGTTAADIFLKSETKMCTIQNGEGEIIFELTAGDRNKLKKTPLVLLVNESTAGPAEIMAAALQAHDRARIIGRKSFGKGIHQENFTLSNGGEILLTVGYYVVGDTRIQDHGVIPDLVVQDKVPTPEEGAEKPAAEGEASLPTRDVMVQKAVEYLTTHKE